MSIFLQRVLFCLVLGHDPHSHKLLFDALWPQQAGPHSFSAPPTSRIPQCKKAEELGAEPLVVAAHDKNLVEQLLLGSVSKFCVSHCKRPVLLLHPNHSQL